MQKVNVGKNTQPEAVALAASSSSTSGTRGAPCSLARASWTRARWPSGVNNKPACCAVKREVVSSMTRLTLSAAQVWCIAFLCTAFLCAAFLCAAFLCADGGPLVVSQFFGCWCGVAAMLFGQMKNTLWKKGVVQRNVTRASRRVERDREEGGTG